MLSQGTRGKSPDPRAVTGFIGQVQGQVVLTVGLTLGAVAMIIAGAFLRRVGSHGLAGSGVVLDPARAREDVRPWSEMRGGILRDTLEGAGLAPPPGRPAARPDMPFDEKLRRLHKLREEGLISEEEYQRERKEILDSN